MTSAPPPIAPKPLANVKVVEIGHSFAAPYAGLILAGLGAEVIKVENPGAGDYARGWGPPFWKGTASTFLAMNRGKFGITVDLNNENELTRLRDLVSASDVVIQNLKPGALAKKGFGPDELMAANPRLVYCDIGSFGNGPMEAKPGYDPLMQAVAGIMSVTGDVGLPPVRVGVSLVDIGTGMWSALGILSALMERGRTGKGSVVSTSLFETALAWMTVHMAGYLASGEVRKPHGSGLAEIVPYQVFDTADGQLMIAAGNDNLFARLCGAIGRKDLADSDLYRKNADRVANRVELLAILKSEFARVPLHKLSADLDAVGVPNAPLLSVDAVAEHEQTAATGLIQRGAPGTLPIVGLPVSFDGQRPQFACEAPEQGEHNARLFPK